MGEAKLRMDEIEAIKAAAVAQQRQKQQLHFMTAKEAVYVNGFFLSSAGPMVRLTFLETSVPDNPSHPRFAAILHPGDFAKLLEGGANLLKQMEAEALRAGDARKHTEATAAAATDATGIAQEQSAETKPMEPTAAELGAAARAAGDTAAHDESEKSANSAPAA